MITEWVEKEEASRTLATEGLWSLVKLPEYTTYPGFSTSRSRYVSLVKHECYPCGSDPAKGPQVHKVVTYPEDSTLCWRCDADMPEQMIVLWTFQNWEVTLARGRS